MATRYALAKRKAQAIIQSSDVTSPPVPVERIALEHGAIIRYRPFKGDLSGMVHIESDQNAIIGVNSMHPLTRKRFTIAHELGHLLLHADEQLHVDEHSLVAYRTAKSTREFSEREIEANQFAAELLMPLPFLEADVANTDLEDENEIERLAHKYRVSLQAMTVRLSRLRFIR